MGVHELGPGDAACAVVSVPPDARRARPAAQKTMGAMADGESDDFKRILLEGNPVLLGVTFAVSMLHSVFDMLAFKNDIGFWKNKKNVEGLSVRTILINCVCQARPRRRPRCSARALVSGDAQGAALCSLASERGMVVHAAHCSSLASDRGVVVQATHCRHLFGLHTSFSLDRQVLWAVVLTASIVQGNVGRATSAAAPAQFCPVRAGWHGPGLSEPDAAPGPRARGSWSSSCTCWTTTPATSCSSAAAWAC